MLLDVIRHGATASTLGHRFNDDPHEPLAPEAVAALAGIAFDAAGYDRIDVSSLRRAVETGRGRGAAHGGSGAVDGLDQRVTRPQR